LRRRLRAARRDRGAATGDRGPALVRGSAVDPGRSHRRLARFLPEPFRLHDPAARPVFRRAAQGHAARKPLPQVLPATDRAAARRGGRALGRGSGARRPRRRRCAGRGARAAGARHGVRRPRRRAAKRERRADPALSRRRHVRAGAQPSQMNLDHFGMDTITLAGPLEAKLRAVREARFTQIMLSAQDIVGHPGGEAAAVAAVHKSGLRVTGFQVLRDFEGLDGHLHAYKVDVAKAMLGMCRALRSRILLVCSSASAHATGDFGRLVKDLQKLAMLAVPLDIRIAYEALSWGRHVNEYPQAWEIVQSAARENLGLALDSFHILANRTPLDTLDEIEPRKIFIVQLSDFLWQE